MLFLIKAVNHQIVEVTDIKNKYYERALLIVKADYKQVDDIILDEEAQIILKDIDAPSALKRSNKHIFYWCLRFIPIALLGGLIGALLTILFF